MQTVMGCKAEGAVLGDKAWTTTQGVGCPAVWVDALAALYVSDFEWVGGAIECCVGWTALVTSGKQSNLHCQHQNFTTATTPSFLPAIQHCLIITFPALATL